MLFDILLVSFDTQMFQVGTILVTPLDSRVIE